jgi:hypothetical protein
MSMQTPTLDRTAAAGSSGRDCRIWERHGCEVQASCQPVAARNDRDIHWPATLRDLSVKGVGLVVGRRFEPGAGLAIELPETPTRPADTLLARVMHATALPDRKWLLGCSLVSELGADELEAIVGQVGTTAKPEAAAPPEPFVVNDVLLRHLEDRPGAPVVQLRRLLLTGTWPPAPGTVFKLRLRHAPADAPWLRVKVHHCTRQDGRWTVAYTVAGATPVDVLHFFGVHTKRR